MNKALRLGSGKNWKIKWFCDFRILYVPYIILKCHGKTFCKKSLDFVKIGIEKKNQNESEFQQWTSPKLEYSVVELLSLVWHVHNKVEWRQSTDLCWQCYKKAKLLKSVTLIYIFVTDLIEVIHYYGSQPDI